MELETRKISDPELRRFAESGDPAEQRSILIELGIEPTPLEPARHTPPPRRGPKPPPGHSGPERDDLINIEGHGDQMQQLEQELTGLGLTDDLVRLDTAQMFVASANPAQLQALARLPLVGTIRPNRTHRVHPRSSIA